MIQATRDERPAMDVRRRAARRWPRRVVIGSAAMAIVLLAVVATRAESSDPVVERASFVVDSVRRGTMRREVHAAGTLVPERVRIIAAVTAGRVEQLPVRPGTTVEPTTLLVELSNPDVQLEQLESDRSLTAAEATLVGDEGGMRADRLALLGALSALTTQLHEARRQLAVLETLAGRQLAAPTELAAARDRVRDLETRERLERERSAIVDHSSARRLSLQARQVERLRAISRFHEGRATSMRVRAGENGVLQELPLELGQWVNPGMILARVAQPGRLKAVLRVPEAQVRDVALGQRVSIDTRNGIAAGQVMRIAPAAQGGSVEVEVALVGEVPRGARAELGVDGVIEIERLENVLYTTRPARSESGKTLALYRLAADGRSAARVLVEFGAASVTSIEVRKGLAVGDRVIVSDLALPDGSDRVRIR